MEPLSQHASWIDNTHTPLTFVETQSLHHVFQLHVYTAGCTAPVLHSSSQQVEVSVVITTLLLACITFCPHSLGTLCHTKSNKLVKRMTYADDKFFQLRKSARREKARREISRRQSA